MIIKSTPEDFIVEEIPIGFSGKGDYTIYRLTKKDYNTESAVEYICNKFNIPRKNIKYAGSKDRHAITTQYISIYKDSGRLSIDSDDIKLRFFSFHDEPLSLGSLLGNKFNITIRALSVEDQDAFNKHFSQRFIFPNYFDDQRFSDNNYEIGLSILKRDFKRACELANIEAENNDYVNALKKIPSKTLLFYIHAVQAYIFNMELTEIIMKTGRYYLKDYSKGKLAFLEDRNYDALCRSSMLKLAGFDSHDSDESNNNPLAELGLSPRDFIIKQFPELSVEGTERACFVDTNIFYKKEGDDIFLEFSLPKGCYATMLIKALF